MPRSRTAWLANLLTWDKSFCYHEATFDCANILDFQAMMRGPSEATYVGDADPNLGLIAEPFLKAFPDARIVAVSRKFEDSLESEIQASEGQVPYVVNRDEVEGFMIRAWAGVQRILRATPLWRCLEVPYDALNHESTIRDIWRFCLPTIPFHSERYGMLRDLRVTQIMKQRLERKPSCPFNQFIASASILENTAPVPAGD